MKTFKLAIATLAIVAAASGVASAASFDSNGNIPNHGGDKIVAYTDSVNPYIDQTVAPAATLSASDAAALQLQTNRDRISHNN